MTCSTFYIHKTTSDLYLPTFLNREDGGCELASIFLHRTPDTYSAEEQSTGFADGDLPLVFAILFLLQ